MSKRCEHEHFRAQVAVTRLWDDDEATVTGYQADVRIECVACGEPFTFKGVACGMSSRFPMVSVDGTELRLPVVPRSGDPRYTGTVLERPSMPDPRTN